LRPEGLAPETGAPGKLALAVLVTATLILVAAGGYFALSRSGSGALDRDTVVVIPFDNETGDSVLNPVGRMAAEWITEGLARTGLVKVVPSAAALLSWEAKQAGPAAGQAPRQIRAVAEEIRAGTVIWGAYYLQADSIRFQAQITDAVQGRLLSAVEPVAAPSEETMNAIEVLRQRVAGALANSLNPRLGEWAALQAPPPSYEAYREYAAALEAFMRVDYWGAAEHAHRAVSFDSTYAPALIFAALGHLNIGEYAEADSLARLAEQHGERLGPIDEYQLQWLRAERDGDRQAAYRAIRGWMEIAPSGVSIYSAGHEARKLNRPRETIEILSDLDPERADLRGWYRYWAILTEAHHMVGDHREELKAAQRGRQQYPGLLSTLWYEVQALAALGRVDEVNERLDESLALPPQRGWTPGWVMSTAAMELGAHGYRDAARQIIDRAVRWYRARPSGEASSESHRAGLARALYLAEHWEESQALTEDLAAEFPENWSYRAALGLLAARQGDGEEALRVSEWLAGLSLRYLGGSHTYDRACIASLLGERERAVTLLRETFAQGTSYGTWVHRDPDLEPLRDYPPFQDLLRPKG
ncbi:MAG: hypothetical protein JSV41_03050, partial [Gemmatimonadota bacterium]